MAPEIVSPSTVVGGWCSVTLRRFVLTYKPKGVEVRALYRTKRASGRRLVLEVSRCPGLSKERAPAGKRRHERQARMTKACTKAAEWAPRKNPRGYRHLPCIADSIRELPIERGEGIR